MTHHPHRNRDDETPDPAGEDNPFAYLEHAEPEAIPPQGPAEVPAHTGNGVPPGLKPNTAKVAAEAVAEALGQHLPQMLFQAVAAALQQVPVQAATKQRMCGTCLLIRITWEQRNAGAMRKAIADGCEAAGVQPGSPQAGQLDLAAFLPPDLRPGAPGGMPAVQEAVTTVQGSEVCPMHIPGVDPGRGQLLAVPAMSPAMLAQFAAVR